jgi:hypothetical protein
VISLIALATVPKLVALPMKPIVALNRPKIPIPDGLSNIETTFDLRS